MFSTGIRVRCLNQADIASEAKVIVKADEEAKTITTAVVDEETLEVKEATGEEEPKTFSFENVFGQNASGRDIYLQQAKPLLDTALEGNNVCLGFLGQSGAGKTYTLAGGILPALSKDLFASERLVSVEVSYVEIHEEKLGDLLNPDMTSSLVIREQPGYGVYISNITKLRVANEPELMKLVDDGELPRQNPNSTTILTLWIRSHAPEGDDGDVLAKLQLVEFCALEPNTPNQQALGALGNVISELASMTDASHRNRMDFQESILTWLLKEAFGGNCKTALVGCISPTAHAYPQTLETLRYVDRSQYCRGCPMPNSYPQYALIKSVNTELQKLKQILEVELEIEDEDEILSRAWIDGKAASGHEVANEYLGKEKLLLELGASEEQKQEADKEKKSLRTKSMRRFKADDAETAPAQVSAGPLSDAPVIEEEDTPDAPEEAAPAVTEEEQAAPAQEEEAAPAASATEDQQTPVKQEEEGQASNALVAATVTTPTRPMSSYAESSPRAKIYTYSEPEREFGVSSPRTAKNQTRRQKICLDHLGVDVPSEEQLQDIYKVFDPNGDGKISLVEFRSVFKDAFENFGAPMEDRDVDRLFAKFDSGAGRRGKAHDGFLSYEEFCVLVLNRLRQ